MRMHQLDVVMDKTLAGGGMQPPLTVAVQQVWIVDTVDVHMLTSSHQYHQETRGDWHIGHDTNNSLVGNEHTVEVIDRQD